MVVLLHHIPRTPPTRRDLDLGVRANFETEDGIAALLDCCRDTIPDVVGCNVADPDWPSRIDGRRVLNYTLGFGLLEESVRPTLVLEAIGADYRGSTPAGVYLSTNKPHASDLMAAAGFLRPRQDLVCGPLSPAGAGALCDGFDGCEHLVVKPAYEDSSVGLAVVVNDPQPVRETVTGLWHALGGVVLVQEYVPGLDVTVPVIGRSAPSCLPVVELRRDLPDDEPFVFDADRKHSKDRVHYAVPDWPADLLTTVYDMALASVRLCGLRDYSRMDCRLTPDGRVLFLEVNANPQLGMAPASFGVSARAAGLDLGEVLAMVVADRPPPWGVIPPVPAGEPRWSGVPGQALARSSTSAPVGSDSSAATGAK